MSLNKDILEGMISVFDLSGSKNFNGFDNYPSLPKAIGGAWHNVGCHISNSVNKYANLKGLKNGGGHYNAFYPKTK